MIKVNSYFSCNQQLYSSLYWSVGWSVQNFPTLWQTPFLPQEAEIWHGGQVCVCLFGKVCVCAHDSWLKGGVAMGGTYRRKAHNFQMDSQTCPRFSGNTGHEPEDSWLTCHAIWQKGATCGGMHVQGHSYCKFTLDSHFKIKECDCLWKSSLFFKWLLTSFFVIFSFLPSLNLSPPFPPGWPQRWF